MYRGRVLKRLSGLLALDHRPVETWVDLFGAKLATAQSPCTASPSSFVLHVSNETAFPHIAQVLRYAAGSLARPAVLPSKGLTSPRITASFTTSTGTCSKYVLTLRIRIPFRFASTLAGCDRYGSYLYGYNDHSFIPSAEFKYSNCTSVQGEMQVCRGLRETTLFFLDI